MTMEQCDSPRGDKDADDDNGEDMVIYNDILFEWSESS